MKSKDPERTHIPISEERRVLQEVRHALADVWDGNTEYILVRTNGRRFRVEELVKLKKHRGGSKT